MAVGGTDPLGTVIYDWIDNLGRGSPQDLRNLPEPVLGESFSAALGGRHFGQIVAVESGWDLTGTIMGAVTSSVLAPVMTGCRRGSC